MARLKRAESRRNVLDGFKLYYEELRNKKKNTKKQTNESKRKTVSNKHNHRATSRTSHRDRLALQLRRIDDKLYDLVVRQD